MENLSPPVLTYPLASRRLQEIMGRYPDGALRAEMQQVLDAGGVADLAWLAGERDDVPAFLRGLDGFVLPSLAEGVSNTLLEAMATALPIIATAVGGNVELLEDLRTGRLVPSRNVDTMARALLDEMEQAELACQRGAAARREVESRFSLDAMVMAYARLYDRLLAAASKRGALRPRFT